MSVADGVIVPKNATVQAAPHPGTSQLTDRLRHLLRLLLYSFYFFTYFLYLFFSFAFASTSRLNSLVTVIRYRVSTNWKRPRGAAKRTIINSH